MRDASPGFSPDTCSACHVLDGTDGNHDGILFDDPRALVRSERSLWHVLKRAEDHTADRVTTFAGSMRFVYIHAVWFGVWIVLNIGLAGAGWEFDTFPFGLLTMIVSLEAIFLATFVMISQNRQAARSDLRSQLDFESNLRSEIWSVHIGQALGIDPLHVESVVSEAIAASERRMSTAAGPA